MPCHWSIPTTARAWWYVQTELGSVIMVVYRVNWQVLLSVFVEYVELEGMLWNLRVDHDDRLVLECPLIEEGIQQQNFLLSVPSKFPSSPLNIHLGSFSS